jgi:hypothetical protein
MNLAEFYAVARAAVPESVPVIVDVVIQSPSIAGAFPIVRWSIWLGFSPKGERFEAVTPEGCVAYMQAHLTQAPAPSDLPAVTAEGVTP